MGRRLRNPLVTFLILIFVVFVFAVSQGYLKLPKNLEIKSNSIPAGCGELKVYVLNVSQADAILIQSPANKTILIDTGSGMKKNSSERLASFLEYKGISRIDHLIATHYHEDHIGGAQEIFTGFSVGSVYSNGNCANSTTKTTDRFNAYAATSDYQIVLKDKELKVDGCISANLIIAYDRDQGCYKDENDNSILLKIEYGNASFLFTGDCEGECENELIRQGTDIRSDFLKVGHHGSATSSTSDFLDLVDADYYVISTDKDRSITDRYFHPRVETLSNIYMESLGLNVFRTDLNGNVMIISDGRSISVQSDVDAGTCDIFSGYKSADTSSYGVIPELAPICN